MIHSWLHPNLEPSDRQRHVGYFEMADELLLDLVYAPDGTQIVGVEHEPMRGSIKVFISHPDIPAAAEGDYVQQVEPVLYSYDGETNAEWSFIKKEEA